MGLAILPARLKTELQLLKECLLGDFHISSIFLILIPQKRWFPPYAYYNEHCIVFNELHTPMTINHQTFKHLFSFLDQFPHYMIGSNADLPIVGYHDVCFFKIS